MCNNSKFKIVKILKRKKQKKTKFPADFRATSKFLPSPHCEHNTATAHHLPQLRSSSPVTQSARPLHL